MMLQNRLISALALAVFACGVSYGQNAFFGKEKRALQSRVDSLQCQIDSLNKEIELLRTRRVITINQPVTVSSKQKHHSRPHNGEATDSLMTLWFDATAMRDYGESAEYAMDSVRFSSNVSDSVMMQRLKDMNPYITLPFNEKVKNYMILYSEKMPSKMSRMLGLSNYYMPIFEETLDRYHLPLELKYMAVIESALNPVAESRAGARGMWQFMYRTGRQYGLKINSFVDERLDVEKAADAAARYLRDAYDVFGDWCLAISSYNCGPGNVTKAIRRAGSRDFWAIYDYLPRETRGYMPAFVGAMYAFTYYKEYGIVPEDIPMPARTDTFVIRRNLHFKQITEVVGVPEDMLKTLNPQYTHDIIPGNEAECILKLPYNWSAPFMAAEADSLYNHRTDQLLNPQILKNIAESGSETRIVYKVKNGDNLGRIASRHHCTVNQLMKWNHLKNSNIRVGQKLIIYKKGAAPVEASKPQVATSSQKQAPSTSGNYTVYTVKAGDTFYSIAKQYPGVSAQDIMSYNGITTSNLSVGKKLRIPSNQ